MSRIENLIVVKKIFLVWQSADTGDRYLVATIEEVSGGYIFSYNEDSSEYKNACEKGFTGYPAFSLSQRIHSNNIMATFSSRLPPRSRADFAKYLKSYCLPEDFSGSDIVLLAYTGGSLPSDRFSFIPDLDASEAPFDYLMEVAGTRYCLKEPMTLLEEIKVGDIVQLELDLMNTYDKNAIGVFYNAKKIGYVNRLLCQTVKKYFLANKIQAVIGKKNGTNNRPLIYLILRFTV